MTVLAGALAHARVTRLVTADRFTLPLRAALVRRVGPSHWAAYLAHCRWCAGLWLAAPAGLLVAHLIHAGAPVGLLLALAYSHTTALLARAEEQE